MKPRLMHGYDWTGQDVSGWWISEKLDGWRCLWDGKEFISRSGDVFNAPAWFKTGMPEQSLDGELWAGPGTTHDDVNAAIKSKLWDKLTFRPFDIPTLGLSVECAMSILSVLPLPSHVRPVSFWRIESTQAAMLEMRRVVDAGGEGVMVRKPNSGYSPDYRSEKLLKLKPTSPAQ